MGNRKGWPAYWYAGTVSAAEYNGASFDVSVIRGYAEQLVTTQEQGHMCIVSLY
jgi:hypothetical protein